MQYTVEKNESRSGSTFEIWNIKATKPLEEDAIDKAKWLANRDGCNYRVRSSAGEIVFQIGLEENELG